MSLESCNLCGKILDVCNTNNYMLNITQVNRGFSNIKVGNAGSVALCEDCFCDLMTYLWNKRRLKGYNSKDEPCILSYKGFSSIIHYNSEDNVLWGKIGNIGDTIIFEGDSCDEIVKSFHNAVDDYVKLRNKLDKEG